MCIRTMSMGSYDEAEHERREQKSNTVDASFDDDRVEYHGELKFDNGASADDLLDQFKKLKSS